MDFISERTCWLISAIFSFLCFATLLGGILYDYWRRER